MPAQRAGGDSVDFAERIVKLPDACKTRLVCNACHRIRTMGNQAPGNGCPSRPGHRLRTGTHIPGKKMPQITVAHAKTFCQFLHRTFIECPRINQGKGPLDSCPDSVPRRTVRHGFGPTPQAGTKPGLECQKCGSVEPAISEFRGNRRANRTTENTGTEHPGEETTVKPGIPVFDRLITGIEIKFHD